MIKRKFFDTYGHCIIKKNTLLFRGHSCKSYSDIMFFGTKLFVARNFSNEIQVWKTVKDIHVLFLIEYINRNSHVISALPKLYNCIFPNDFNENYNDLDIKHWNINRRNMLTQKLFYDYGIKGWLTSLEDKLELEVCLFDKNSNSEQIELVETFNGKKENYFKDSLVKMEIFPNEMFFVKTKKQFSNQSILIDEFDSYKQHKRAINTWIKEESKSEKERIILKHYYFDLRSKLKI